MQNPNLRSKIAKSVAQSPKTKKNILRWDHRGFFLVITLTRYLGSGPDLVGIFPRSLPQLSQQLSDQNNSQKQQNNETQNFEKKKNKFFMFWPNFTMLNHSSCQNTVLCQESDFQVENVEFWQSDVKNSEKNILRWDHRGGWGHNSYTLSRIWTRLGGNFSQESPAAF